MMRVPSRVSGMFHGMWIVTIALLLATVASPPSASGAAGAS